MTRRWNWDFEDEHHRRRPPRPAPLPPPLSPAPVQVARRTDRAAKVRRRRVGAVAACVALLALPIAVLSGGGHHKAAARSSARSALANDAHTHARQPSEPENDAKAAVASVLGYTPFIKEGSPRARNVALTFDDGPGPYTPQVLAVLERMHVHATFFVVGRMLRYFGSSAVREIEDGDVIGDHTEDHSALAQLTAHDQREQLFEQSARVELLGAPRPVLFRPPYGSFDATTWRELRALHMLMVLWSVDTGDYAQPGVQAIVQRALEGARPGAIILMHDAGGTRTETVAALPAIIDGLRRRGYRLVTVPRLLMEDPPPAGQQIPTNLSGG